MLFSFSLLLPSCNFLLLSKYPKYRRKSLAALEAVILRGAAKLNFKEKIKWDLLKEH